MPALHPNSTDTKKEGFATYTKYTENNTDCQVLPEQTEKALRNEKLREAAVIERELYHDYTLTPIQAAIYYFDNFSDCPPENIRVWTKLLNQKAWRKYYVTGQYRRAFDKIFDAYLYTLTLEDLQISKKISRRIEKARKIRPTLDLNNPLQIYLNATLLKDIVQDNLLFGSCYIKLEATLEGVHIHAIAERQALCPHLKRLEAKQQGRCVPVYNEIGVMAYLNKPVYSVKRYSEDLTEEATLKFAADIEAYRDYAQTTGKHNRPKMLVWRTSKKSPVQ